MKHWSIARLLTLGGILFSLAFPAAAQEWIQLDPIGTPPLARGDLNGVYDPTSNRLIIFGGLKGDTTDTTAYFNDVWVLTNANGLGGTPEWIQLFPDGTPPESRRNAPMVYDATANRLIIFGGTKNPDNFNDTWVLTNANGLGGTPEWIQLNPSGSAPHVRGAAGVTYDATSNRMTVFGGVHFGCGGGCVLNDTWVLTNANGLGGTPEWIQLDPIGDTAPLLAQHLVVYDRSTNRLTAFGWTPALESDSNALAILENANGLGGTPEWTLLDGGSPAPSTRSNAKGGYDSGSNRMVSFAGLATTGEILTDSWVLLNANGVDPPSWEEVIPSNSPPSSRIRPAVVYDQVSNRLIVFGGASQCCVSGVLNDVWVLTNANGIVEITVQIDIKPGSDPNAINLNSRGRTPVAILGTFEFEVAVVDVPSIRFAGAAPIRSSTEDVNDDGLTDLVLHFLTQDLQLTADSTEATLTGMTVDGNRIKGTDSVEIVQ